MRRGVLLFVGGDREVDLVRVIDAPGTGVTVTRRCADVAELLAAAAAGLAQCAVVDAAAHGLDIPVVARIEDAGVRVVVLVEQEEASAWVRATRVVDAQTPAPRVLHAVLAALASPAPASVGGGGAGLDDESGGSVFGQAAAGDGDDGREARGAADDPGARAGGPGHGAGAGSGGGAGVGGGRRGGADGDDGDDGGDDGEDGRARGSDALDAWTSRGEDPGRALADLLMPEDELADLDAGAVTPGRVVAVWGTPGAPGRSTIAANLAAELAHLAGGPSRGRRRGVVEHRGDGRPILLMDADTEAPCQAQLLGMLEDASSMAAVARRASHGRLTAAGLLHLSPLLTPGLHVTTGLGRAERWRELPSAALEEVLRVARTAAQVTVLDLGAGAEEPPPGLDAWGAPPRHGATRTALAEADVVLVVGSADPVGVRRLIDALATLEERALAPDAQILPVVTKVRASAAGPHPGQAVLQALDELAEVSEAVLVPDDRAALDACLLQGRLLAELAENSPARAPVADLARWLLPAVEAPVAA